MRAFAHLFDDLVHEGFEIAGIAAGDEALIGHDRLVAPLPARIDHVGLDRVVGRALLALDDARLDQQPRRVADRGDRLAGRVEGANDLDGLRLGAQLVRIDLAAGQHERVVFRRVHIVDVLVDGHGLAPIRLVPAIDLAGLHARFRSGDFDGRAGIRQLLLRHHQFRLLEAVGRHDEDLGLFDVRHDGLRFCVGNMVGNGWSGVRFLRDRPGTSPLRAC